MSLSSQSKTERKGIALPRPRIYRDNAHRQAAYRRRKKRPVYFSHQSDEWETPAALFAELDREFHFTTDVAALPHNAKCDHFFTPGEDGLQQTWEGVCWMNPPYGPAIKQWVKKARESARAGVTVVCLVPSRTDTLWWHDQVQDQAEVRFLRGRVKFGGVENSAPFPSAILVFRPNSTSEPEATHGSGRATPCAEEVRT
jgi:phage N-6-adenine-methyltransferase